MINMQRLMACMTAALAGLMLILPAQAQHTGHHAPPDTSARAMQGNMQTMMPGMMQGDMQGMMQMHGAIMEAMMKDPVHRTMMMASMLPAMQEPLNLTAGQTARLDRMAADLRESMQSRRTQMMESSRKLSDLVASGTATRAALEEDLKHLAEHRAEMQARTLDAGLQMQNVLTPDQREMLASMTPMQMQAHMSAGMDMTQMMGMMQAMQGTCMMMDMPGMMGGGMMQNKP